MASPLAVRLYRWLCGWIAFVHVGIVAFGGWLLVFQPPEGTDPNAPIAVLRAGGALLIGLGIGFGLFNLYLAVARPKPWHYVAAIGNQVAGLLFCLPLATWLLFFWFRDDVKAYYGVPK